MVTRPSSSSLLQSSSSLLQWIPPRVSRLGFSDGTNTLGGSSNDFYVTGNGKPETTTTPPPTTTQPPRNSASSAEPTSLRRATIIHTVRRADASTATQSDRDPEIGNSV
jgi:hypothetical protein